MSHHPQLDVALRLGLAFVLVLPLGWERDRRSRSAGLRTYPLLSVCVCGILLLATRAGWEPREQADAFYGVLTGIGFVVSAAFMKADAGAAGMSTAVSLWVTGAIGTAVAYGQVLVAAALSLATVLTLWGASLTRWRKPRS
jgi:putative Mg2+ transporter-C (MgtC) family protein